MTLEQAKKKLEQITSRKDPMLDAFIGGRVGFRKPTKKYSQEIERKFGEATEVSRLREFIKREEDKLKPKVVKPSPYFASVDELEQGGRYVHCMLGVVTVVRKNKSTVTVQTASGYKEASKPTFIYKKAA